MCGIVGYIGPRDVLPVLVGGLKKLEYRGYDSSGVAFLDEDGRMNVVKAKGRVALMEEKLGGRVMENSVGIGHTRWATHGEPSDVNAHPIPARQETLPLFITELSRIMQSSKRGWRAKEFASFPKRIRRWWHT